MCNPSDKNIHGGSRYAETMASMLRLDFNAPAPEPETAAAPEPLTPHRATPPAEPAAPPLAMHLFGDEPELPPTWSEGSSMYHTSEKCNRLRAILPNNRVQGKPGLREHCLTCQDIAATKRRG